MSVYRRIGVQQNLAGKTLSGLATGITGLGASRVNSIPSLGTSQKDIHQMSNCGSSAVSNSMRASFMVHKPALPPHLINSMVVS